MASGQSRAKTMGLTPLTKDELAALSPYQTQHIKRFGNYVIDLETLPQPIDDDELAVLV